MLSRVGLIAAVLASCVVASAALASPQSQTLVKQGQAALKARNYQGALDKFRAAEQADPKDADAFFLEGATRNRGGEFDNALAALQQAQALGSRRPDLLFELGWSQTIAGNADEAVKTLSAYETAHPGRGLTSEFLGRADAKLGKYDDAVAKLKEAMTRDPRLKGNALFYMAVIEQKRGNLDAARADLAQLQQAEPNSLGVQVLQAALAGK